MKEVENEVAAEPRHEQRIPQRPKAWGSLLYHDFRLLWFGLTVSQVGYWMQFTSLTYLLGITLAHTAAQSAINLALLGATRSIPVFVFGPIAGYVADRYPRRRTLIIANIVQVVLALALAIVAQSNGPWTLPIVLAIAGGFAAAQSFDYSARGSWVSFLVPRPLIGNAIGLISFANNVPLMVGPAIAGILISAVSVYFSFYLQAVTQWAPVIAIFMMKPAPVTAVSREPMFQQIAAGIKFVVSHAVLRWLFLMMVVVCTFVRPFNWLLAGFSAHVMHVGPTAYGTMLAIGGIGTVLGAFTTAISGSQKMSTWFYSAACVSIGMVVLSVLRDFWLVVGILAFMGWATMSFTSRSNVLIQMLSPEHVRGRTMSLYSMIQNGCVPVGTLILGSIGAASSLPIAYALGGVIALVVAVWVWTAHPALREG